MQKIISTLNFRPSVPEVIIPHQYGGA